MSTAAVFTTNFPVLVDGELWTNESVFWQGKLKDGEEYMTVHCTGNPSTPAMTSSRNLGFSNTRCVRGIENAESYIAMPFPWLLPFPIQSPENESSIWTEPFRLGVASSMGGRD
jgi:hypothetical protein